MLVVNKRTILQTCGLIVIILSINFETTVGSFPSGTIREENYVNRNSKIGINNIINNKLASNKETANKEVIFGSDDDEEEDEDLKQRLGDMPSFHAKPVLRSQRIDFKNMKHHDQNEKKLKSFHNNKDLQRNILNKKEHDINLDYDSILDELLQDSEFYEDLMNMKDIGTSIGKNRLDDLDQENMPVEELVNKNFKKPNLINKKKLINLPKNEFKPINYVDVEENLLGEKEYNNKFIHEPKFQKEDVLENDLFENLNLENLKEKTQSAKDSVPINSNPSLINKQSNPTVDPTIDAKIDLIKKQNDYLFIFVVAGCTLAGVIAFVAAGVCWYTVYRSSTHREIHGTKSGKLSPSGSLKSNSTSSGDRRLAQSAQMYHYQHQKQQMIAMEKANNDAKPENSDNSDGETEEGDYTVYECPGLAPTGEMEVKNPLFKEDYSPSAQNIFQSTLPPAYSTAVEEAKAEQLIELDDKKETNENSNQAGSVSIEINETSPTTQN